MDTAQENLGTALLRQKWIVLGTVLVTVVAAYTATYLMPPLYEAEARVMVAPSRYTPQAVASEAQLVRSSTLAETVINDLSLQNDPEWFSSAQSSAASPRFLSLNGSRSAEPVVASVNQSFLDSLSVQPVTGSYVLAVRFRSHSPEKAARIANAFAQAYLSRPHSDTLETPVLLQQISDLQNSIVRGEQELNQAAAQHTPPPSLRADLLRERDELAKRYGPLHPRMIDVNGRLTKLDAEAASPAPAPAVAELTARLAEQRSLKDKLAARLKSLPAETGAKIVSLAAIPTRAQRELPDWLLGSIPGLGLLLGLFLALFNDRYDRGFRTDAVLEEETGFSALGTVPVPVKTESKWAAHVLQKPSSPEAEAVRALRAGLKLTGEKEGRPLKVITLTSSHQDDPRTLVAIWLARLAARSGEKVLLVDADLREPRAHEYLGHSNTPSLVDYLTGHNHLEQIIWKQDMSGMHVIFGSPVPNTALDLVSSEKMRKMMGYLRQGYDFIVVCAPPCLTSADAALLANESDQALYLVTARSTYRATVRKGLKLFADFGYTAVSLALLNPKKL
jgi:capsular exopolysaccharide synthesis family protein